MLSARNALEGQMSEKLGSVAGSIMTREVSVTEHKLSAIRPVRARYAGPRLGSRQGAGVALSSRYVPACRSLEPEEMLLSFQSSLCEPGCHLWSRLLRNCDSRKEP